jgi:predicted lactoylglutathione lyase
MAKQIFINLPVADLKRSMEFFTHLGFTFNPQFTDDKAACMVIHDNIFTMLLVREYFAGFTHKPVADAFQGTEVLIGLDAESREAVDELVAKAVAAGGKAPNPAHDHGFMYQHGFEDLDGHVWEVFWMGGMPS